MARFGFISRLARRPQPRILTYCLAHEPVMFRPPSPAWLVELGPKGSVDSTGFEGVVNAYDILPHGAEFHPYLGGTLGSFAVLRHLASIDAPDDAMVNVTHYRRFISPVAHGIAAENHPGMQLVTPAKAQTLDIGPEIARSPQPFLVARTAYVKNLLRQYAKAHRAEDLLHFTACAVAAGVITGDEAAALFNDDTMTPGGIEFGVSPVPVFRALVGQIEKVCLAFLDGNRPAEMSGYQRRALNYCSERLGSFLLKRECRRRLGKSAVPKPMQGYMHVVSDEKRYAPGT